MGVPLRVSLLTLLITCVVGISSWAPLASAAGVYGHLRVYDVETEEVDDLPGRRRIEARISGQLVRTTSHADGSYRFHVGPLGTGVVTVMYKGQKLSAEFNSRYYDVHYDIYVQHRDGEYRLLLRSVRTIPPRRNRPDD